MSAPGLQGLLLGLRPDGAVILGTAGICLIFLELNRPGRIVPGALGLLFTLGAVDVMLRSGVRAWAAVVLFGAAAVLAINLWRQLSYLLLLAATVAAIVALRLLVPAPQPVHTAVAVLCGVLLGGLSAVLTRIAYRARRAKALH